MAVIVNVGQTTYARAGACRYEKGPANNADGKETTDRECVLTRIVAK